jgi:List-Bact-rpt repeat protein/PASTA domain-containing protein
MSRSRLVWAATAGVALLLLAAGIGRLTLTGSSAHKAQHVRLTHQTRLEAKGEEHGKRGGEAGAGGPAQARYDDMAFPRKNIAFAQVKADHTAFNRIPSARGGGGLSHGRTPAKFTAPTWQELGPVTNTVPGSVTYTGRASNVSGRVTAMAIAPTCSNASCVLYVGAAGGGIWKTTDALAQTPKWTDIWNGPASNAIGSIAIDPHNANTIYVGTGEPSGSSDSEAGVGMYKSTDGGATWSLVASSVPISKNRAIGTIAIDPSNSNHILIGTDVARHGDSSVNGGRLTPPGSPKLAVYESTDGGGTWTNVLQLPQDTVDPNSANGGDFFAGGITKILFDPNSPNTVYASSFTSGIWRRIGNVGVAGKFQQIFHAQDPTDTFERTEFALAAMPGGKTRIWAASGDASYYDPGLLWRVDDASLPASALLATEDTPTGTPQSWKLLSAGTVTDPNSEHREPNPSNVPGFTSFNLCQDQCSYDLGVWSPAGQHNTVVVQGSMEYNDIFGDTPYSNGAAVIRSTNAGTWFSDMTNDALNPPNGLHPDQRALAFDPNNPNIFWVGSDGGVVRVGGTYTNASSECNSRDFTSSSHPAAAKAACKYFLSTIPSKLDPINNGLPTLQFQSVTVNQQNPNDLIGGTQDNGTWAFDCSGSLPCSTFESVGGDGGQSAIDATTPSVRTHSYYDPQYDTNFHTNDPTGWDWISDPLIESLINGEQWSFYPPFIQDPTTHGYEYTGGQYVWRTTDDGGKQAYLDSVCNEYTGSFTGVCGDWKQISPDLTAGTADDKGTGYIVAIERAPSDNGTMWVGTRRGRIFVTTNAHAAPNAVTYDRIDTPAQPRRFPSGISIDPSNPDHAYISFTGYNAYTPTTPGHVFEVTYDPSTHKATWKDLSYNLGDQPINDVAYVPGLNALFAATDFGVLKLDLSTQTWTQAANGLPQGAVFGLRYVPGQNWLFAATHGRGAYKLNVAPPRTLAVTIGAGKGHVTSSPAGISCPSACSDQFDDGTQVTLKATPAGKFWKFVGWGLDCSGNAKTCTLTMDQNHTASANFAKICIVPKVKGLKLKKAKKKIRHNNCKVGKIKHKYSKKIHKKHVIKSKPRAGSKHHAGFKVKLYVSKGKRHHKHH